MPHHREKSRRPKRKAETSAHPRSSRACCGNGAPSAGVVLRVLLTLRKCERLSLEILPPRAIDYRPLLAVRSSREGLQTTASFEPSLLQSRRRYVLVPTDHHRILPFAQEGLHSSLAGSRLNLERPLEMSSSNQKQHGPLLRL